MKEKMTLEEALSTLRCEGIHFTYDEINQSFDEESRLSNFPEYLYEVREMLVRKGFSRGKQADNYEELRDIAHRCCRLGKSKEDCVAEIKAAIK